MAFNVVLGVTGGIATYKSADLVSRLINSGINVDVIMTQNACEFINPLTFQTLSKNPVVTDTFSTPHHWEVEHISLAKKADLFLIAPATANIIGKIANGIADDMLTTTILATRARVIFAPAMNVNMYENPIFQGNIAKLKSLGYEFIDPDEGTLACGDFGKGRMAEPGQIAGYIMSLRDSMMNDNQDEFKGKRILVTAGPTVEDIDPVRYISNRSSGKMGYAIAESANKRGADVTLVSGPVSLDCPKGVKIVRVRSTKEMMDACLDVYNDIDVVIKAAAPADFCMDIQSEHKIKKSDDSEGITFSMKKTPDILAALGKSKKDQILVGFAAETRELEKYAREKIEKKNLDMVVANNVSSPGAGFDCDTNIITIVKPDSSIKRYPKMSKYEAAEIILDNISYILNH